MGLHIEAYSSIVLIDTVASFDEMEIKYERADSTFPVFYIATGLPKEWSFFTEGLKAGGVYRYTSIDECWLNYRGYAELMFLLADMAFGVSPMDVIANPLAYVNQPFYSFITFPDLQGWLGPQRCKELAQDFATFDTKARATLDEEWYEIYQDWSRIFSFAANTGAVEYS